MIPNNTNYDHDYVYKSRRRYTPSLHQLQVKKMPHPVPTPITSQEEATPRVYTNHQSRGNHTPNNKTPNFLHDLYLER